MALEDFRQWLNERDSALIEELNRVCSDVPLRDGLRDAAMDAIDAKRERLATALNLIDEFQGSR